MLRNCGLHYSILFEEVRFHFAKFSHRRLRLHATEVGDQQYYSMKPVRDWTKKVFFLIQQLILDEIAEKLIFLLLLNFLSFWFFWGLENLRGYFSNLFFCIQNKFSAKNWKFFILYFSVFLAQGDLRNQREFFSIEVYTMSSFIYKMQLKSEKS